MAAIFKFKQIPATMRNNGTKLKTNFKKEKKDRKKRKIKFLNDFKKPKS